MTVLDPRAQRTRQLLQQGLQELLSQKRYKNISIQQILEHAQVSRSTFYAHFESKEALLYSLEEHLPWQLEEALGQGATTTVLQLLFEHAHQLYHPQKVTLWSLMLPTLEQWIEACWEVEQQQHWRRCQHTALWKPVATAGIIALLKTWLEEEGSVGAEQIACQAQALLLFCLKQAL